MSNALIVVDVQRDFCEGGALGVEGGNRVAKDLAKWIPEHQRGYDFILFTKDWHNAWPDDNGGHFSEKPDYRDTWPVHCVGGSPGAMLHPVLSQSYPLDATQVFYKGQGRPSYSGFEGKNCLGVSLNDYLSSHDVEYMDICGIAGDYCVRHTIQDAMHYGYDVQMLPGLVASVGGDNATIAVWRELFKN